MSAQATEEFFGQLSERRDEPLLATAVGSIRWEVSDGSNTEHWFIELNHGEVTVNQGDDDATVVATMPKEISEGIVTGRINATAAFLRGTINLSGDFGTAMLFQRLFPGPPASKGRA